MNPLHDIADCLSISAHDWIVHADALRAQLPLLRRVRLTTWMPIEIVDNGPGESVARFPLNTEWIRYHNTDFGYGVHDREKFLLAKRWPGIEFEFDLSPREKP